METAVSSSDILVGRRCLYHVQTLSDIGDTYHLTAVITLVIMCICRYNGSRPLTPSVFVAEWTRHTQNALFVGGTYIHTISYVW